MQLLARPGRKEALSLALEHSCVQMPPGRLRPQPASLKEDGLRPPQGTWVPGVTVEVLSQSATQPPNLLKCEIIHFLCGPGPFYLIICYLQSNHPDATLTLTTRKPAI